MGGPKREAMSQEVGKQLVSKLAPCAGMLRAAMMSQTVLLHDLYQGRVIKDHLTGALNLAGETRVALTRLESALTSAFIDMNGRAAKPKKKEKRC